MGKISPVSIKYVIHANFSSEGSVEKPDVIGALFGQTEGLLGSELEMRELQKEGKIGRIDVNLESQDGKTIGKIQIPSALDKAETALIGAAIETIEKIGPTEAHIEIERIEDVRGEKRGYIVGRAKKLLEQIQGSQDTREMADDLKTQSRLSKLQEYGEEKLPAGDISESSIIVVEGRADVINLIKNGVDNVIGMNGTKLPETIKNLSYDKEITLFVDGDRGGKLIAKNVSDNARIDFIAVAPDGKEVEELSDKEILQALRKKIPEQEFFRSNERRYEYNDRYRFRNRDYYRRDYGERRQEVEKKQPAEEVEAKKELTEEGREKIKEMMDEIEGTKSAYLLDENLKKIKEISSRSVSSSLLRSRERVYAIVMDGTVTMNVVKSAEGNDVKIIAAKNFAYTDTELKLLSL